MLGNKVFRPGIPGLKKSRTLGAFMKSPSGSMRLFSAGMMPDGVFGKDRPCYRFAQLDPQKSKILFNAPPRRGPGVGAARVGCLRRNYMCQGAKEKPDPEFPGLFGDGCAPCLRPSSKRTVLQERQKKSQRRCFNGFSCRLGRLSTK